MQGNDHGRRLRMQTIEGPGSGHELRTHLGAGPVPTSYRPKDPATATEDELERQVKADPPADDTQVPAQATADYTNGFTIRFIDTIVIRRAWPRCSEPFTNALIFFLWPISAGNHGPL
jgi:hypothetical protein